MPKVLMELMRHEDINTTLRFYVGRNAERTASIVWEQYEKDPSMRAVVTNLVTIPENGQRKPKRKTKKTRKKPTQKQGD